jgi:hypothetical protein
MSSTNADYIAGYNAAIQDLPTFGMNLGKIPTHNQKDFYLEIEQGAKFADWVYEHPGVVLTNSSGNFSCPAGHTKDYCAGWNFGDAWEDYARDGM